MRTRGRIPAWQSSSPKRRSFPSRTRTAIDRRARHSSVRAGRLRARPALPASPLLEIRIEVVLRDDVDAGVVKDLLRRMPVDDIIEQPHGFLPPAEVLLTDQKLHLAGAQQVWRRRNRIEGDDFGARRVDRIETIADKHRPTNPQNPTAR